MAKDENSKTPEEKIAALEKEVKELKKRGGGMLSSKDFRDLVITREKDDDYSDLHNAFSERDWERVGRRFIIDPYDELNVTPFSYDLSIGNDIFSVRKKDR